MRLELDMRLLTPKDLLKWDHSGLTAMNARGEESEDKIWIFWISKTCCIIYRFSVVSMSFVVHDFVDLLMNRRDILWNSLNPRTSQEPVTVSFRRKFAQKSSIMTVDLGQKCPSHKVLTESTNSEAMTEKVR